MGKNLIVPNVVEDILMLAEKKNRIQVGGVNENEVFNLLYRLAKLTEDKKSFSPTSLKKAKSLYSVCRKYSVSALKKMGYAPRTPGIKSEIKGETSKIPTLLKVLWWYMSFQAQNIELNFGERVIEGKRGMAIGDQTILGFLNEAIEKALGFKLAKKTFTEFAVSPSRYLGAVTYNQIKLPNTYAGAKVDAWGYPINYLSRIVKEYDIFLDLFGGGGYATLAVNPLINVEYYINEFSFLITVYYQVLADESLYLQFKDLLGVLVKAIEGDSAAIQYFANKGINGLSADDCIQNMREIYLYYMGLIKINDLKNVDKWLQHSLRINDNGFSKEDTYHRIAAGVCEKPFEDQVFSISDSKLVEIALAFMLRFTFTTGASSESISSIKSKKIETLLSMLKNDCFDVAHDRFRNIRGIANSDSLVKANEFIIEYCCGQKKTLLNKRETFKKCLIYSDSPYLATQGYDNKKKDGINPDSMHELIDKLVWASERKNHFIFSCRGTCTTTQDVKYAVRFKLFDLDKLGVDLDKGREFEDLKDLEDYMTPGIEEYPTPRGWKHKTSESILKLYQKAALGNKIIYEELFKYFDNLGKFYVLVTIPRSEIIKAWKKLNPVVVDKITAEIMREERFYNWQEEIDAMNVDDPDKDIEEVDFESNIEPKQNQQVEKILSKKGYSKSSWKSLQLEAIKNMLLTLSIMEVYITDFDYVAPPDYHAQESKTDISICSYMKLTLKEFLAILKQYMIRMK